MALTESERFAAYAEAFASVTQNIQAQRAQIAQYAIQKAAAYLQNSKNDEAIKEFNKALAFDPQNSTAHTYLGKIYLNQGKTADAIREFKSVVDNDKTSVTAHNNLGNAYLQAKQYANAEKEFKTAAKLDPIQPLADYTLGILYTQTERYSDAEAQFKKVEKRSPKDGNVYYALGALYNKTDRTEEAVTQLMKALSLKKDFPAANYELGTAYMSLGDVENAQKQLDILQDRNSSLATDLSSLLNKPKMLYIDSENNRNFNQLLGPGTPLWMLDPTLLMEPNSSKRVSVAIQFNNEMDIGSIMDPSNWDISRANDVTGGYYNNTLPPDTDREVSIPKRPMYITYNPDTRQASVTFVVQQNENGDATIDPKHLVFKFSGKDANGRQMDTTADQIDGYSTKAY